MSQTTAYDVDRAVAAFEAGEPVLVADADDREGETDLIYPADAVEPVDVAHMRNDAGGLVCVALSHEVAEAFELPFLADELDHPATERHDLGYDDRSSFSLPVNHRDTYTGITDEDRSLTIRALADAAADADAVSFGDRFRAPGHVHVLKAAPGLLADRHGHTELAVALAHAADRAPAAVVCEMLDDETGRAREKSDVRDYAERRDLPFLDGAQIVERLG